MAALEHRVITGILRERDMTDPMSAGLVDKEFKDAEARQIYKHIYRWWHAAATRKTVPTVAAIRRKWPSFEPTAWDEDEDGSLKSLIHELKMRAYESDIRGLAQYFMDLVEEEEDPADAVGPLKRRLDDLAYRIDGGTHLGLLGIIDHAEEHYERALSGDIYGVPWPWEPLTQDTLGKLPEKFIVFYGRMKSMKTWLILYSAAIDFQRYHQRVLIWSREMDEGEIALRLASILGKVDYQLLKKGRLPPKLKKRAFKVLQDLKDMRSANLDALDAKDPRQRSDIIIMSGPGAPKTVDELRGAISTYQPDVVYVDSFYHLHTERAGDNQRWLKVATLAEDLKAISQDFQIPVVATTQANREGDKSLGRNMAEIADSDNIAREADLVIRVIKRKGRELYEDDYEVADKEEKEERAKEKPAARVQKGRKKMQLRVSSRKKKKKKAAKVSDAVREPVTRVGAELALILGANRDGILEAFTIHAIPGYNFKVIDASFSSDEIQKWVDTDNKGIDKDQKREAAKEAHKKITPKTFTKTRDRTDKTERT